MTEEHHALQLVAELMNDLEQVIRRAGIQPIIYHDILELIIELLGDDLGQNRVNSARRVRRAT
jgi:hypothetical protein